ncbi:histidine phosphatase family protein [bacterium]|nr:histidine phosphatase family protein [bacterium]
MEENNFGRNTLKLISDLKERGINRFSVIMRHSARHYDRENPQTEPFQGLTEEGKEYAYNLGKGIPRDLTIRLFSSTFGRCIETAYLIDKGFTAMGGSTINNTINIKLAPSYVKKPYSLAKIMREEIPDFVRYWFEGNISTDIIDSMDNAAIEIVGFLVDELKELPENHVNITISHDWNMYLIKEHFLDLKHEAAGKVEYLEGAVIYKENDKVYMAHHQCEPGILELS